MVKCATRHPADWREGRRLRAWELKQQGWSQRRIAEAHGFTGNVWTHRRMAAVIRRELGVRSHPASLTRLLRQLGWSPQQPQTRATQRDEAVIRAWFTMEWPALSAKPVLSSAPSCS